MITNRQRRVPPVVERDTRSLIFELIALAAALRRQGKLALAYGAVMAARSLRLGKSHV